MSWRVPLLGWHGSSNSLSVSIKLAPAVLLSSVQRTRVDAVSSGVTRWSHKVLKVTEILASRPKRPCHSSAMALGRYPRRLLDCPAASKCGGCLTQPGYTVIASGNRDLARGRFPLASWQKAG